MDVCSNFSPARKRYERDSLRIGIGYGVTLIGVAWAFKHGHLHGALVYVLAALPAFLVMGGIVRMGRYLIEEKDDYERMLTVRAILVATTVLLGTIVITDFTRAFANASEFPPFIYFAIFMVAMGITQVVNRLQNRGGAE